MLHDVCSVIRTLREIYRATRLHATTLNHLTSRVSCFIMPAVSYVSSGKFTGDFNRSSRHELIKMQ